MVGVAPSASRAGQSEPSYERRQPETTTLYRVVQDNLATLYAMSDAGDGPALPKFVRRELEGFLDCGVLSRGFAHLRCERCTETRLVAFSCKGRGFCPSCTGRRMAERAATLVDDVLPAETPLRHWVLSMPHPLRAALAYDRALAGRVSGLWARTLVRGYERFARDHQRVRGQGGAVLVIQRTSSDLKLNPHFHMAVLDGVFVPNDGEQGARFVACEQLDEAMLADAVSSPRGSKTR